MKCEPAGPCSPISAIEAGAAAVFALPLQIGAISPGVLALYADAPVQLGVGIEEALVRLRAYAYAYGRRLADVAADVVAHRIRLPPDPDPGPKPNPRPNPGPEPGRADEGD
jgi:hypothetical protein